MNQAHTTEKSSFSTTLTNLGYGLSLAAALLPAREGFAGQLREDAVPLPAATAEMEPAPAALTEEQIAGQIRNLGSNKWAVREQASRELIEAGTVVLAAIQLAKQSNDAEVSLRATYIESAILKPILSAPSTVTLQMIDQPVLSVLKEIERQTGNQIEVEIFDNAPITVRFSETPFWTALLSICDMTGNTIMDDDGPTGWHIEKNFFKAEWFSADGPFLVKKSSQLQVWSPDEPVQAPLPGGLRPPPKAEPGVGCMFYILCEPRVALDGFVSEAIAFNAVTDSGERLLPIANNTPRYRSTRLNGREENRCMTSVSWPNWPARSVTGGFLVESIIHGNTESVRLPINAQESLPLGNGQVSLLDTERSPEGGFEYSLVDTLPMQEGVREVLCFDDNGRRLPAKIHEGFTVIEGKECLRMRLSVAERPAVLEYRVHRFSFQSAWNFSFEDFSLPAEARTGVRIPERGVGVE